MTRQDIYKFMILVLLITAAAFIFIHFELSSFFSDRSKIVDFITGFGPLSVVVFIAIQILQVLVAPIPGEVTGFIGGFVYGIIPGTLYSTIGLTIGSWLAFTLSRTLGLPFVEKVVSPKIIEKYDAIMKRQGPWVAFLLFLIPGFPKDALCYVLGLSHIRIRTFLLISTVGRLLGTLMLSVQGNFLRNNQDTTFLVVTAVGVIVVIVGYLLGKKWFERYHRSHPPHPRVETDHNEGPGPAQKKPGQGQEGAER
jgi:uncharacterized membrane protein YdjX (TVP38/TMEM64 family)